MRHLLFFDGTCPLCHRAVRFVIATDKKKVFLFAPLQGETARLELGDLRLKHPELDSLVLLENYEGGHKKTLIEGKAAFRILWHLGGGYRFLGLLSFLPSFLFDLGYRFIAKRRYKIFRTPKPIKEEELQDRLLP